MTTLQYPGDTVKDQLLRLARRKGLHFYIDEYNTLVEDCGPESETREATGAEIQMCELLMCHDTLINIIKCGGVLEAEVSEVSCISSREPKHVYMHEGDILSFYGGFKLTFNNDLHKKGVRGKINNAIVYHSPYVPKGYYLKLDSEHPNLIASARHNSQPYWDLPRLDVEDQIRYEYSLKPIML